MNSKCDIESDTIFSIEEYNKKTSNLKIIRKPQSKGTGGLFNYFLNPALTFTVKNARVFFLNEKTIVFIFKKHSFLSIYSLFRHISKDLLYKTSLFSLKGFNKNIFEKEQFSIYFDKINEKVLNDDDFTIKMYYDSKLKYISDSEIYYGVGLINSHVYDSVTFRIENLWEDSSRVGFHIHLLSVNF
jgi:hypothetical protein